MSSALTKPAPVSPAPDKLSPVSIPPAPRQPESRKWLIVVVVLVLAGLGYMVYTQTRPAVPASPVLQIRTAKLVAGPLDVSARVTGQTAARNFANITAPRLTGPESSRQMLIQKIAASGSWVKKGDIIAEMDATSARDHIDDVEDTVEQAKLDVNKRKAEQALDWENLQQTLRVAKSELDKARLDAQATEVRTVVDQELIKLAVDEAEARYKQSQADVLSQKAVHEAELRILQITYERHLRHVNRHKNDYLRYTIRAPMDGLVVLQQMFRGSEFSTIQDGDQVFPGQPMLKVVDPRNMQVEGVINQSESSRFRIGQRARVRLDAFPGTELEGKVASIGALAAGGWRNSFYIRNVPIRIQILGSDPKLIPDLSASAEVYIGREENASTLPLSAMQFKGDDAFVRVKKGEKFEPRQVEVGSRNFTHIAIKSGLQPDEEVRIN
jgi:HlyD family secretion protein